MNKHIIGVDMGGTKVQAASILDKEIKKSQRQLISSQASEAVILNEVIKTIEAVFTKEVAAIGIGVPSVVDVDKGIVYDVQNIPSWQEVHVKTSLEKHFNVPVYVNNDANCFAIGEKHFGEGKGYRNMIGLIIGTGMAAGIVINDQLYNGHNCGAGEFGMIPYQDSYFEHYCSGQFFDKFYQTDGFSLSQQARQETPKALEIFNEYGMHLGNAITTILFSLDPEIIVLGGSVSKSYPFFQEALWRQLQSFPYRPTVERLKISVSKHENIALLGAAALCL